jgi:hypothetical protein
MGKQASISYSFFSMASSTERVNWAFLNFLDGHLFFIFFFLNFFVLQIDESGNLCLYIEAV